MSTFPGYIPELPGIAIDRFDQTLRDRANVFFLSHGHLDHMYGLVPNDPLPGTLYVSPHTAVIVGHRYPNQPVYRMPIRERLSLCIVPPTGEERYELCIRTVPAEHCPGSVMFYFETQTVRVLYTGDFRLSAESLAVIERDRIRPNIVYLDSTFLDWEYKYFPTRQESMSLIIMRCSQWLEADRRNIVVLWLPALYGSEELLHQLYVCLRQRIHVCAAQRATYQHFAQLQDAFTDDAHGARIHACSGKTVQGVIVCRGSDDTDNYALMIRPSARRWRFLNPGQPFWMESKKQLYVCYSSHASSSELVEFIRKLQPEARDIRFSVVGDEIDRKCKEKYLASLLATPVEGAIEGKEMSEVEETLSLPQNAFSTGTGSKRYAGTTDQKMDWDESEEESDHANDTLPPCKMAKRC
ncbi:protein artemis-like [Anopheles maculipalpis]|uniref:protein artemis-like n=1 Tax=Anopheles maculipalpis TaxID=1496333 RepID=UPI002159438C|nr:protein artemis-like [Anopheles maculipalpis]